MGNQDGDSQYGLLTLWWQEPLQQKLENLPKGVIMRKVKPKEGGTFGDGIVVELSDGTTFEITDKDKGE